MKKLLKELVSLASECDKKGFHREAGQLDNILVKISQMLPGTPVGVPYKDVDGTMVQNYRDAGGNIVKQKVKEKPSLSQQPDENKDESSFIEKYNPFAGLYEALSGNTDSAIEQQEKSELPHLKR